MPLLSQANRTTPPGYSSRISVQTNNQSRYQGTQIRKILIAQSFFSNNLKELSNRTTGLLPIDVHRRLFSALKTIEPLYRNLIWNKSKKQLEKQKAQLTRQVSSLKLNKMFKQTVKFYGSDWPDDIPFFIGLYPVPYIKDFKNTTSSHSMGNIEEHGVIIGDWDKTDPGSFGVVFHELCHSVYDAQPFEFMKLLDSFFSKSQNPSSRQARFWFNEALATAMGNGWTYTQLEVNKTKKSQNKKDTSTVNPDSVLGVFLSEPWYNDEIIDGYAKGIYPLALEYITKNKTLDEAFVKESIEIFSTTFPNAAYSFENLLTSISFIHNKSFLLNEDAKALRSYFRTSSLNISSPLTAEQTLSTAQLTEPTLFILLNENESDSLLKVISSISFLKDKTHIFEKLKNRSIISMIDSTGRGYIVMVASTKAEFLEGLSNLKKWKSVDPKKLSRTF